MTEREQILEEINKNNEETIANLKAINEIDNRIIDALKARVETLRIAFTAAKELNELYKKRIEMLEGLRKPEES